MYLDTETFNEQDIAVGTYKYASTAEVLLITYALDGEPVRLWDRTQDPVMPFDLEDALRDPSEPLIAHNAIFDRLIILHALGIRTDIARWRCTMVKALSHGFPGALSSLGAILGLPANSTKLSGGSLIARFCKPAPRNHIETRYTHETHPEEWQMFCRYAVRDTEAMQEIDRRLPAWNCDAKERALYHLDQQINDRGFYTDTQLISAAITAAESEKKLLANRFIELTQGAVEKPSQRERFRNFLNSQYALELADTRANTFKHLLDAVTDLPDDCRELLTISLQANKTSTAKYTSLGRALCKDARFRGGLQFSGAARTRRWAGRVFQPHNLPARDIPPAEDIDRYIRALKAGIHDALYTDLMKYSSAALRGVLIAPAGKKLCVADLSNIEGRVNAWLAGETWKLAAFAAFDRGDGPDLYNVTAGQLLGRSPYDITKAERQVLGKIPELALGYEGGVGAFQTFSQNYGVRMAEHWPAIRRTLSKRFIFSAQENWEKRGRASGLDKTEWIASEAVKLAWRHRHPAIVRLWSQCKAAAEHAIQMPGRTFRAGKHLSFRVVSYCQFRYLLVRLPSGNFLCYFEPAIDDNGSIRYSGIDATTRQWTRLQTYGGKIVENACQSLSRDILAHAMPAVECAGFPIVLTVHDEIVTEVDTTKSVGTLIKMLSTNPPWATGLPLAADGVETTRYHK